MVDMNPYASGADAIIGSDALEIDGVRIAAAPAVPVLGGAAGIAIASAIVTGIGIGWNTLSPGEQARAVAAVTGFFLDALDPQEALEFIWHVAANAFRDVNGALDRHLNGPQKAELEKRVRDAIDGRASKDEPEPDPQPAPVKPGTRKHDDTERMLAFRAVIRPQPTGDTLLGSAYVELSNNRAELPRNVVVNRLVQTPDPHDIIHALTGFGLNGIGADRIGAPFPATGIEVEQGGLGPPPEAQRNLNGLYIELLNDGFYEAIAANADIDIAGAPEALPAELQQWGRDVSDMTRDTTGYRAINGDAEPGTDYHRHAEEAERSGIVVLSESADEPGSIAIDTRDEYVTLVRDRFAALLERDPALREVLATNYGRLLRYAAARDRFVMEPNAQHPGSLEIILPPRQTETILRTAILALDDIIAAVWAGRPGHVPEGLIELRDFYRSMLEDGTDGTPELVRRDGAEGVA